MSDSKGINWNGLLETGLGALGGSLINGTLGLIGQNQQIEKSKELLDYQWNKMYSPLAQVKNLAAAGVNPAVAFGNNAPVLNSGGQLSMPDNVLGGLGTSSLTDISNYLLAKASAKKANVEAEGTELDNIVKSRTQEDRIKEISLRNKFTEEETTKVINEWQKLVAEANILQKDSDLKQIDLDTKKDLINAVLRNYADKHNLDSQQFNSLKEQLPVILDKLKAEKNILEVDAQIADNFKSTMSSLGVVGQVLSILKTLIGIVK